MEELPTTLSYECIGFICYDMIVGIEKCATMYKFIPILSRVCLPAER